MRSQRLVDCFYRQEQFKFVGWHWNKTKLLIVAFGILVFRVYEKANSARRVENLYKLPHGRHQQCFPDASTLARFGNGQPAQPNTGHITR